MIRAAWLLTPVALGLAGVAAAAPAAEALSFVACPIARDTGPDTDLCFVAEHAGRLYALTNPSDFGQPQLKHRVLVEGKAGAGPAVCGATPVEGRISVLSEVDPACDQVLPFDGSVQGVAGGVFNSGTPEQRAAARDLARRAEADPSLSILPAVAEPPPLVPPVAPFERKAFTVYYPFDSDRASGPDMLELVKLVALAKASGGKVEIAGWRGASKLSDGGVMTEREGMAKRRADKVAGIMEGLGVSADKVSTRIQEAPARPTGGDDWKGRRVEIAVIP